MHLSDFNYELPQNLIAQKPAELRSESRLLVANRHNNTLSHNIFSTITQYLPSPSLLVFNDTKVINARLIGKTNSGANIECFLVEPLQQNEWLALLKPARKVQDGDIIQINHDFSVTILTKHIKDKHHKVRLNYNGNIWDAIDRYGKVPLPPYIKPEQDKDYQDQYQTIFAKTPGAIAAPTACLHFTEELIAELPQHNIDTTSITLHVGYGTFNPIQTDAILDHEMHHEHYSISESAADKLNHAKKNNIPIIAVGTTVVRALESNIKDNLFHTTDRDSTQLFITPGYQFNTISGLITNFHLPKSTLLILVSAFAETNFIKTAYSYAIDHKFRFFSFGDAMLIL